MATVEQPTTAPTPRDERPITRTELREELRHYATKADLAELETRMVERMAGMESRLIRWMIGMMFSGMLAAAAIASVVAIVLNN